MLSENLFLVRLKRGMLIEIKIEVIVDMDVLVVGFVLHVHVVLTFLQHGVLRYLLGYITLHMLCENNTF